MGEQITERKLAWMAGVIETRGKLRRVDNPMRQRTTQLVLQVQSRHLHVTGRLCDMTGVRHRTVAAKRLTELSRKGCLEHCPEAHVHVAPTMPETGIWAVTGAGAAIILHNLIDYLYPSDAFTDFIADAIDGLPPPRGRGRHAVEASIARLEALGWEIPEQMRTTEPDEPPAA